MAVSRPNCLVNSWPAGRVCGEVGVCGGVATPVLAVSPSFNQRSQKFEILLLNLKLGGNESKLSQKTSRLGMHVRLSTTLTEQPLSLLCLEINAFPHMCRGTGL